MSTANTAIMHQPAANEPWGTSVRFDPGRSAASLDDLVALPGDGDRAGSGATWIRRSRELHKAVPGSRRSCRHRDPVRIARRCPRARAADDDEDVAVAAFGGEGVRGRRHD